MAKHAAPAMCRECERAFLVTLISEGPAAAVRERGADPCPHTATFLGVTFIGDPEMAPSYIMEWHPLPQIEAAYAAPPPTPGDGKEGR